MGWHGRLRRAGGATASDRGLAAGFAVSALLGLARIYVSGAGNEPKGKKPRRDGAEPDRPLELEWSGAEARDDDPRDAGEPSDDDSLLLRQLERAREAQREAEEQLRSAQFELSIRSAGRPDEPDRRVDELRAALARSEASLAQVRERLREAEARSSAAADERIRELESALGASESERASLRADRREGEASEKYVRQLEEKLLAVQTRLATGKERADGDATVADTRIVELEEARRSAEAKAETAVEKAREFAGLLKEARAELEQRAPPSVAAEAASDGADLLAELEARVVAAEERAQQAERRLGAVAASSGEQASERASDLRRRLSRVATAKQDARAGRAAEPAPRDRGGPVEDLQAAVANELRGPLSTLRGVSLTLKGVVDGQDARRLVRQLGVCVRKIDQLVQDLADVARIAEGTLRVRRRRTDLEALVTRIVAEADGLEDRLLRLDTEAVTVPADPVRVQQILDALLTNARERSGLGQTIIVGVAPDHEGGAVVSVADEGPTQPTVGPELSLAVRLAELHGGELWVEPLKRGGSFRVRFPGGPRPAGEDGGPQAGSASTA